MRKLLIVLVACGLLVGLGGTPASADTHAPSRQTIDLQCGGQVLTFVSPNFHALAGQALDSTRVGVVLMITAGEEVLFRSPDLGPLACGSHYDMHGQRFDIYVLAAGALVDASGFTLPRRHRPRRARSR